MSDPSTSVAPDTVRRITAAANQLHAESGCTIIPTVDQVRRLAKTNMHDAALVMKTWRQAHAAAAQAQPAPIPDKLQQAGQNMLTSLWQNALEEAGTQLLAAQAGWERERAEGDLLRKELSTAYDVKQQELQDACAARDALQQQIGDQETVRADLAQRLIATELQAAVSNAAVAELHSHVADLEPIPVGPSRAKQ